LNMKVKADLFAFLVLIVVLVAVGFSVSVDLVWALLHFQKLLALSTLASDKFFRRELLALVSGNVEVAVSARFAFEATDLLVDDFLHVDADVLVPQVREGRYNIPLVIIVVFQVPE
jgi:hypothetical protein